MIALQVPEKASAPEMVGAPEKASAPVEREQGPQEKPGYHRSPRALAMAIAGGFSSVVVIALVYLLDLADAGLRADLRNAVDALPARSGAMLDTLAMTVALVWVSWFVVARVLAGRWRVALTCLAACSAMFVAVALATAFGVTDRWVPANGWAFISAAACAANAAAVTVAKLAVRARAARMAGIAAGIGFILAGPWAGESLTGRVLLTSVGCAVGALAGLVAGTPSMRASAADVFDGLQRAGLRPTELQEHEGDARGSRPWLVTLESGAVVFVKTMSREERNADLLFRAWRHVRLRDGGDGRPPGSLLQAVEHEALVATRAGAAGVRTPRVLAVGPLANEGAYLAFEAVPGRSLDDIVNSEGPSAVSDASLREAWSMVTILHRSRIAHRDLRAANVVVDDDGAIWLVDFAVSELGADEAQHRRDVVELLCSSAALVGVDVAAEAAVATLGEARLREVIGLVQPLATSRATAAALGSDGFETLRVTITERTQAPVPTLPRLGRVDLRSALSLLILGAALWVLLPQIAGSRDVWQQLPRADPGLLALAGLFSVLSYAGASLSIMGATARSLPRLETFAAQLASSFVNRIAPARLGGIALNVRWLVGTGASTPTAGAAVSLNAAAGFVTHVVLTVFTVLWAGREGVGALEMVDARVVAVALGVVCAFAAGAWVVPPVRRLLRRVLRPRLSQGLEAATEVLTDQGRLVRLIGGSLLVTTAYIGALAASLAAMGVSLPLASVALVYLAGTALASAAPTPGGLGATEAVLAAGLIASGLTESTAVASVLVFRAITFWLPLLPGWLAFWFLRHRGRI